MQYKLWLPWQNVSTPLHVPFGRHLRTLDPFNTKPSSQLNWIAFGNVVSDPIDEPFSGGLSWPQSLAITRMKTNQIMKHAFSYNIELLFLRVLTLEKRMFHAVQLVVTLTKCFNPTPCTICKTSSEIGSFQHKTFIAIELDCIWECCLRSNRRTI